MLLNAVVSWYLLTGGVVWVMWPATRWCSVVTSCGWLVNGSHELCHQGDQQQSTQRWLVNCRSLQFSRRWDCWNHWPLGPVNVYDIMWYLHDVTVFQCGLIVMCNCIISHFKCVLSAVIPDVHEAWIIMVWYDMVSVDLYSAIVTKVSSAVFYVS